MTGQARDEEDYNKGRLYLNARGGIDNMVTTVRTGAISVEAQPVSMPIPRQTIAAHIRVSRTTSAKTQATPGFALT